MTKLNLNPDYLDSLFRYNVGNDIIELPKLTHNTDVGSVNTQQLYNWYRNWQAPEEGIRHDNKIDPGGFSGMQPAIIFKKGLRLRIPEVKTFYIHGYINTDGPGINPFASTNGTRIIQSKYARPNAHLFISHSSVDKPFVRKIVHKLESTCDMFFDEKDILPGDRITERIDNGLSVATTLLLVLSKHSSASHWVAKEWGGYMHGDKRILIIKIDDTEVPPLLRDIKYINGTQVIDDIVNEILLGLA